MKQILTPTGYKDINTASVGDEVVAFDIITGSPITNIILDISYPEIDVNDFILINSTWSLYKNQSIWVNGNVLHASDLVVGDVIYDGTDNDISITSISPSTETEWIRFEISNDHSYIVDNLTLHNASRFWVGGTGTWDASATTHWSTTTGGSSGASVPSSLDVANLDGSSGGGTVTVNTNFTVGSIQMGTYTGILDFSTNNNSPTLSNFSASGTSVRTLNMGSGTWTITSNNGAIFDINTATNMTLNAGTSTIVLSYSGSVGTRTYRTSTVAVNNLSVTAGTDIVSFSQGTIINGNLNTTGFTGTLNKAANNITIGGNFTLGTSSTWTSTGGTITFNSSSSVNIITNGVNVNQAITINGSGTFTLGSALNMTGSVTALFTITLGTFSANNFNVNTPSFNSNNSNTRTITMGSGTWTITNTNGWNITTITSLTFNTNTSTLNFTGSAAVFAGGGLTYNIVSFTGGGATTMSGTNTFATLTITGVGAGDSVALSGAPIINGTFTITGNSGANKMSMKSNLVGTLRVFTLNAPPAFTNVTWVDLSISYQGTTTWTLLEDLSLTSASVFPTLYILQGTFTTNNFNVTTGIFSSGGSLTRTVNMGSSTFTLTGNNTNIWSLGGGTSLTLNAGTSTIKFTDTTNNPVSWNGASKTYNIVWFSRGTSTGSNQLVGSGTINTFKDDGTAAHSIIISATITITIKTAFTVSGSAGNLITLNSSTTGIYNLINASGNPFSCNYLNIQHCIATPGNYWLAGNNSVNNQNVTSPGSGWAFTTLAIQQGSFLAFL